MKKLRNYSVSEDDYWWQGEKNVHRTGTTAGSSIADSSCRIHIKNHIHTDTCVYVCEWAREIFSVCDFVCVCVCLPAYL